MDTTKQKSGGFNIGDIVRVKRGVSVPSYYTVTRDKYVGEVVDVDLSGGDIIVKGIIDCVGDTVEDDFTYRVDPDYFEIAE